MVAIGQSIDVLVLPALQYNSCDSHRNLEKVVLLIMCDVMKF